jgi:molybdopterin-binding protein
MQAKSNGVMLENSTQFDGQEIELFSGEYVCDDLGVMIQDKYGFDQIICRHPIMPIQRLCNVDTGEERLKIAYRKGRFWRSLIAEKSILASSNSILQLAANGVLVTSENAKKAFDALNLLNGSEAHATVILSQIDRDTFRKLGINLTCEPHHESKKLYHK